MDKKVTITICRQFCSGGLDTAKVLSEKLNIPYYDREIVEMASKKTGISLAMFENADEKPTNSFLYSIALGTHNANFFNQSNDLLTNDKLFNMQSEIVREIAEDRSCIMVGRCTDYILRDTPSIIRVYLMADMQDRIERFKKLEKSNDFKGKDIQSVLRKMDKKRESYYNYYTGRDWDNINNYDIVINTTKIGIENTANQIINHMNYMNELL
ncbi:MAG: cytidylate kinase-like family protein [bacterium]